MPRKRQTKAAPLSSQSQPVKPTPPPAAAGTTATAAIDVDAQSIPTNPSKVTLGTVPRHADQQQQQQNSSPSQEHHTRQKRITVAKVTESRPDGGPGAQQAGCQGDRTEGRHCSCATVGVLDARGFRVTMPSCCLDSIFDVASVPQIYQRLRDSHERRNGSFQSRHHPYLRRHYVRRSSQRHTQCNGQSHDNHFLNGLHPNQFQQAWSQGFQQGCPLLQGHQAQHQPQHRHVQQPQLGPLTEPDFHLPPHHDQQHHRPCFHPHPDFQPAFHPQQLLAMPNQPLHTGQNMTIDQDILHFRAL